MLDQKVGGAFPMQGAPLFLRVSASGKLDALSQDPGEQDGFVISEPKPGILVVAARGSCCFAAGPVDAVPIELVCGQSLEAHGGNFHWTFQVETKSKVEDPLLGKELGGHRILSRLGNGSMGVVYRAIQINLEREVALKVLDPKAIRLSPLALASFKREAVAAGRLSHPNLVQVYDVGQDRGLYFFSMELVPGGDLEERLQEVGPLAWREALGYLLDATEALLFAKEHQLLHRDVKPENLMLTLDGRAKLADLGMAATRGMVEKEDVGGTPHFLAPECVSKNGNASFQSDFYSLGCTLFRLLTNQTPFQGNSVREILLAHRDAPIPRLKDFGVDAPAPVQDLLDWLMAKDPADRPQEAQEILDDVHDILEGKHARSLIVLLSAIAVSAVGVSLFFALRPGEGSLPEQVIVEVESPTAAQERLRAASLERQLAFASAMALTVGPDRISALQGFLESFPDSSYVEQAQGEIQRIQNLPQDHTPVAKTDPFAAEKLALVELGQQVDPLLEQKLFGQARQLLSATGIPAEGLAPLWSRLGSTAARALQLWKQQHTLALAAESWVEAKTIEREMATAFAGSETLPDNWSASLSKLATDYESAHSEAMDRDYRIARLQVLQRFRQDVLPAMDQWQWRLATQSLASLAADCPHPALRLSLEQRIPLFEQAATLQEALFQALKGDVKIPVIEPRDGKRAFATAAGPEGLSLVVQVRGERIERLDSWALYESPVALTELFHAVLGDALDLPAQSALEILLASRNLARELMQWQTPPTPAQALAVQEQCRGWSNLVPSASFAPDSPGDAESLAIQEFGQYAQAMASGDYYAAWLLAQSLADHFSLLAAWSSDGSATWGLQP